MIDDVGLVEAREQLLRDIKRWQDRLLEDRRLAGTYLEGIGLKTARTLDKLLRDILAFYLAECDVDYDKVLRRDMGGKSAEGLTPGQVYQCFNKVNRKLTGCCHCLSPEASSLLRNRRLVGGDVRQNLEEFLRLWNPMHHPEIYFKDVATLKTEVEKLLGVVEAILSDALFEIPCLIRKCRTSHS